MIEMEPPEGWCCIVPTYFFIYSESHSLKAVLLNAVNLNLLLKMKTKWDMLSPKQSCPFCLTSGSTPATRSWVGARKTVLLKPQNETESLLKTQGRASTPHSSWRTSPFLQGHGHSGTRFWGTLSRMKADESTMPMPTKMIVCQFYHISFCPLSQETVSMSSNLSHGPSKRGYIQHKPQMSKGHTLKH